MSVVTVVQCEICNKNHVVDPLQSPTWKRDIPFGWFLFTQNGHSEPCHFCSLECFLAWAELRVGKQQQPVQDMPQSKMRRFLLVDGETADEVEGIVWGSGLVSLAPPWIEDGEAETCESWEALKLCHPGDGVTWIDPEVHDAAND